MQNYAFLGTVSGEDEYALKIVKELIDAFNYYNRIYSYSLKKDLIHSFTYKNNFYEIIISDRPTSFFYCICQQKPHYACSYGNVRQKRPNGQVRFEILFEFIAEPRRLTNVLHISHSNIKMQYRNYNVSPIMSSIIPFSLN